MTISRTSAGLMGGAIALSSLVAGVWLGDYWASCASRPCSLDVETASMLGTWVGGLGTAGAVFVTGRDLVAQAKERARREKVDAQKEARRHQRETLLALHKARSVSLRAAPRKKVARDTYAEVTFTIPNKTNTTVYNVHLALLSSVDEAADTPSRSLGRVETIFPGRNFTFRVPVSDLGVDTLIGDLHEVQNNINNTVLPRIELLFSLDHRDFSRVGTSVQDVTSLNEAEAALLDEDA